MQLQAAFANSEQEPIGNAHHLSREQAWATMETKPHPSLMAITRTGGGLAGKEAWREVADTGSLTLREEGDITYTIYLLRVGHCARHRLICAS